MTSDHPLPSWNDGAVKSAILDFVARVTNQGGPDFVPPTERVAAFDNDGTLWCEQPMQAQLFFLSDRVKELVADDPSMSRRQPFKALLEHDHATLHALGKHSLMQLFVATHAGMTRDEFGKIARTWLTSAVHPQYGRPFTQMTYRPQVELLEYLRANRFKTFIVSGGGVEFIREFAEGAYGIPREQVIGSSPKVRFEVHDGRPAIMRLPELNSFNDHQAKPENICLHIGRCPLLAFGNSDGDLQMFRYTKSGDGPRLALLLHHDDAEREFAYDRDFKLSPLAEALDEANQYGINVISMKHDWNTVFGDRPGRRPAIRVQLPATAKQTAAARPQ